MKKIVGVILVAGKGVRMLPFSNTFPKPLLPVCNTPILIHQINIMRYLNITEIFIVIGHLGYQIVKTIGDGSAFGVTIRYVEQKKILGIAHAVGQLEPYIDSPFLLMLGDIYFISNRFELLLEKFYCDEFSGLLATKQEDDPQKIRKNFAVLLDEQGNVRRVVEKPRHIHNTIKGCGIYLFDQHIFDAIRRTPRTAMRDEYEITDAIQILIDDGYRVCAHNIIDHDINLTFPEDLLQVNLIELSRKQREKLIGATPQIHPGVNLENCVIGNNVTIQHPIHISNTVVFDDTMVRSRKPLNSCIITPTEIIDCHLEKT